MTHQPEMSHDETTPLPSGVEDLFSPTTRQRLIGLAYRFLWNRDDAEDVVQESLVAAYEHRDSIVKDSKQWSWLCRIVIRNCHLRGRRSSSWRKHLQRYFDQRRWSLEESFEAGHGETSNAIRVALSRLPQRQREVVILRHLEGMGFAQIAEILGITASTARVHAQAGREALRESLMRANPQWLEP
ncbi:MAG: RNA polymerase sigma factor [Planctomycetota bacterium]